MTSSISAHERAGNHRAANLFTLSHWPRLDHRSLGPDLEEELIPLSPYEEEHRAARFKACEGLACVRRVVHRLTIDFANDIARVRARIVGRTAIGDRRHQRAIQARRQPHMAREGGRDVI